MKKCIYVGVFAFFGAMLRFFVKNIHLYNYKGAIPVNTLFINLIGSFLMALILTISLEVKEIKEELRLGLTTGFLGAFTTFSTLCKELVKLLQSRMYFSALSYLTMSIIFGLSAAYLGVIVARKAVSRIIVIKSAAEDDSKEDAV
ncbi:fluoride efflux transporter CrcB [Clostridium oryzae]|uniref:Fluoride-specific ion channel FluC n=1 Tax=Clostridium oryzae TaxID=1450648 RepID=A0A1V4IMI6_9CLOT|nr:fluoride efflux transporter CrcB [Clostridium oryzae]OPJ60985.1 putative fluoride ion transporter CrcB [Clostridium oryzae]